MLGHSRPEWSDHDGENCHQQYDHQAGIETLLILEKKSKLCKFQNYFHDDENYKQYNDMSHTFVSFIYQISIR